VHIGFVVEGSHVYHNRTQIDLLERLWSREIPRAVGCVAATKVFGISKASIAAMRLKSTNLRPTTAIAEPLDAVLERLRRVHCIDCFVIAWDLVPPWDKQKAVCRWTETLGLYEGLSRSDVLDQRFRDFAGNRFREMRQRYRPSARTMVPRLVPGGVVAVCMEPLFESVFMDERAMKRSLGIVGRRTKGWPSGWEQENVRASEVIDDAVDAARHTVPLPPVFRRIRQGYETLKTEWGIHFVQSRAFDRSLRRHPLGIRLAEIRLAAR
jgi:hypothetical protein